MPQATFEHLANARCHLIKEMWTVEQYDQFFQVVPETLEPSLQLAAAVLAQVRNCSFSGITFTWLSSGGRDSCNHGDLCVLLRNVALCIFCKSSDEKWILFRLFSQVKLPAAEIAATIDAFRTNHLSELTEVHTPLTSFLFSLLWFGQFLVLLPFQGRMQFVSFVVLFNSVKEEDYIWDDVKYTCSHEQKNPAPLWCVCSCQRQVEHH